MPTQTTYFGLTKPGANETGWGTSFNANLDLIDAELHALSQNAGQTITPFSLTFDTTGNTPGSTFTLPSVPVFLAFSRGGLVQTPTVDYTLAGAVLTTTTPVTTGETLHAQGF